MKIEDEIQRLVEFVTSDRIRAILKDPLALMPEAPDHLIPSIVLSGEGLALNRLLLVGQRYVCDVEVTPEGRSSFDFVAKHTILNVRLSLSTHKVMSNEEVADTLELAQVEFLHELSVGFKTQLNYAGHDRESWLAGVLHAIPIELLLKG